MRRSSGMYLPPSQIAAEAAEKNHSPRAEVLLVVFHLLADLLDVWSVLQFHFRLRNHDRAIVGAHDHVANGFAVDLQTVRKQEVGSSFLLLASKPVVGRVFDAIGIKVSLQQDSWYSPRAAWHHRRHPGQD
jgi:hypothetical protein